MLQRQKLSYCITIAEQYDSGKFNKGLLMNAAFVESEKNLDFDCMVLHDVDMLPEDDRNLYKCDDKGPVHLSPKISKYNYNYPYGTDFGGVTMMSREHYNLVNGHTNMFWGWGKEDADMEYRISAADLKIELPEPIDLGRYTMLKHQHIATWQNEVVTMGVEDDRSTSLKRTLMGMKEQRNTYDGLNSLNYKIIENESTMSSTNSNSKKLYKKLTIDVRRAETVRHEITIGEDQYTQIIDPNQEQSCKYFEFPNSYVGNKYTFKDFKPSESINITACGAGCSGFSKFSELRENSNSNSLLDKLANTSTSAAQNNKSSKHFAFSYPILQTSKNSTVYLKHCENDLAGWQIIPKGIQINKENKINVLLKFTINKLVEDLGQLYYRDSWVYEGQRYKTNNFAINRNEIVTSINEISKNDSNTQEIILENNEFDNTTTITVNLNTKVARGNYMVFSKIVDSFGQPIAELNWFSKLTGGELDMESFRLENTVPAEEIKDNFSVNKNENGQQVKVDKITEFKAEMKRDFRAWSRNKEHERSMLERL